jgi:hypothetical protein
MQIYLNKQELQSLTSYNFVTNVSDTVITLGLNLTSLGCEVESEVGDKVTVDVQFGALKLKPLTGTITEKKLSGTPQPNKAPVILISIFCAKSKWKIV